MDGRLLSTQAAYYVVTGAWPIVSIRTFEAVTGPKTDRWLVRMVGLLAAVIGTSLLRRRRHPDRVLAAGSSLAFASVDVVYTLRGTIRPIYLADALLEVAFAAAALRPITGRAPSAR